MAGDKRMLLLVLAAVLWACRAAEEPAVRSAVPLPAPALDQVRLRLLAGPETDLRLAAFRLARFLDGPQGDPLFNEAGAGPVELPAPQGHVWVHVAGDVPIDGAFQTDRGRLVLCLEDDGLDVTLADFDEVFLVEADPSEGGGLGLRLRVRSDRRRALEELLARATGSLLAFEDAGLIRLAVDVAAEPGGDLVISGAAAGGAAEILRELAARGARPGQPLEQ